MKTPLFYSTGGRKAGPVNDEGRMTKVEGNPNDEIRSSRFWRRTAIRHLGFFILSSFDIPHSSFRRVRQKPGEAK
jgi:hypothetical protein